MELRRDPLRDIWTIIAPERKGRPGDFPISSKRAVSGKNACPFCPGSENCTPSELFSIVKDGSWQLRVFPNKFPALMVENEMKKQYHGYYDIMSGVGAHEVIVPTSEHSLIMSEYDADLFHRLFVAAISRAVDLYNDVRVSYISLFQNKGAECGATLYHPHFQILALPVIPKTTSVEVASSMSHYMEKGRCLTCDIIEMEKSDKLRIFSENDYFMAVMPYASTSPFQTEIYPKNHQSRFTAMNDAEITALSSVMEDVYRKLGSALEDPDYNLILYTSPSPSAVKRNIKYENISEYYHWHIEIIPHVHNTGGSEKSGVFINTVPPEEAARALKKYI